MSTVTQSVAESPAYPPGKAPSKSQANLPPVPSPTTTVGLPRKRVGRACYRCQIKKCKCDGKVICQRCRDAGESCYYTDRSGMRERHYSKEDIRHLENKLALLARVIVEHLPKDKNESQYEALKDEPIGKRLNRVLMDLNVSTNLTYKDFEGLFDGFPAAAAGPGLDNASSSPSSSPKVCQSQTPLVDTSRTGSTETAFSISPPAGVHEQQQHLIEHSHSHPPFFENSQMPLNYISDDNFHPMPAGAINPAILMSDDNSRIVHFDPYQTSTSQFLVSSHEIRTFVDPQIQYQSFADGDHPDYNSFAPAY
ncbi:Fluconazole resistance protein 1 [Rhizina undulata]